MLGREPRLPHKTMRWLIISLLVINGLQLVLLQATINATLSLDFTQTWTFVALSFLGLLLSSGLILFGYMKSRGRGSDIRVRGTGDGGRGTVSGPEVRSKSDDVTNRYE